MTSFTINLNSVIEITDEQFFQLCQNHQDYQFERTTKGELIIMSPTGGETGKSNIDLTGQLWLWNKQNKLGVAFDSSTGFQLPNGADRSPDAAWLKQERWDNLTTEQREKFIPLCPDFVVELRSKSDSLTKLQEKMQEYLENGIKLGWLINRKDKQVEIYRQGQPKEVLNQPSSLSGKDILPEFVLNLESIW